MNQTDYVSHATPTRDSIDGPFEGYKKGYSFRPRFSEDGIQLPEQVELVETTFNIATGTFYLARFRTPMVRAAHTLSLIHPTFMQKELDPNF
jgi:hypothetical protein